MQNKKYNNYMHDFYKKAMEEKDDIKFMLASNTYEFDGELGMIPIILKSDPLEVRNRKREIIKKKAKVLRKKMPELYRV